MTTSLDCKLAGLNRTAMLTALALIGAFALWSSLAPLSSATTATGIVSPETGRRTVQHLEGGIVEQVLVGEGEHVAQGQTIAVLVDVRTQATFNTQLRRRFELAAQIARLSALAANTNEPDLSSLRIEAGSDPALTSFLDTELIQFKSRRAALAAKLGSLNDEITALEANVAASSRQTDSANEELQLVREELLEKKEMLARSLVARPVVLALDRRRAQIEGQLAGLASQKATQAAALLQKQKTLIMETSGFASEIADARNKAETELAALVQQQSVSSDGIRRMEVRASETGTIVSLKVRTPGAVLQPGAPIADLVPAVGGAVLDVRIRPSDIVRVHPGQPAQVLLTAYSMREVPLLPAVVKVVSADAVSDPNSKDLYYKAELKIDPAAIQRLAPGVSLVPGMPVESYINHHRRTLLEWLMEPVVRSFRRGGLEY